MNNYELERQILSAMLINKDACSTALLRLEIADFRHYRQVFTAMKNLVDENKGIDISLLSAKGVSLEILSDISTANHTSVYIDSHIKQLKDNLFVEHCKNFAIELERIIDTGDIDSIQNAIVNIPTYDSKQDAFMFTNDLFKTVLSDMKKRMKSSDDIGGLRTGINDLDEMTDGCKPGEVIFIEAGTNVGKTMLMLNIAYNMSMAGHRVDWFGYEMNSKQIAKRLIPIDYDIDFSSINRPKRLTKEDIDVINKKKKEVTVAQNINIFGSDVLHYRTINEIKYKVNDLNTYLKNKPACIFIDYLRLLAGKGNDRNEVMANNLTLMMDYAAELGIPIFTVIGQNKNKETSGFNDMTYDVHQHWVLNYDKDSDSYSIEVRKNRDGAKGEIKLAHSKSRNRFRGF